MDGLQHRGVINNLENTNGKSYLVGSEELTCKGRNSALEKPKLSQVVHNALLERHIAFAAHISLVIYGVVGCAVYHIFLLYQSCRIG